MKFDRLRISGFKSFVDPTELLIPEGMTGVVGPNGCGKSNLLEALRWVMGETSYKNLRGSGMEDVIFSGSADRPARNTAEVTVTLDNSARQAPAVFNADETLEVSRRIERDAGSAYHVNGRDVRARDVQMLFADASTGAHSVALVRQGQIGEIIAAKPQDRRRILEEAAGISGLHHRRHEAELRLRAADSNLERLEDVAGEIENQLQALKRQARQAKRYRNIAGDIRKSEALLLHLKWVDARGQLTVAQDDVKRARQEVEELTRTAAIASHGEIKAGEALPAFRDAEVSAAAGLQRLKNEDHSLATEAERASERQRDLEAQIARIGQDLEREARLLRDNQSEMATLGEEKSALTDSTEAEAGTEDSASAEVQTLRQTLEASEAALATGNAALAELRAASANLGARSGELATRAQRIESEFQSVTQKLADLDGADAPDLFAYETALAEATRKMRRAEDQASTAETALKTARKSEAEAGEAAVAATGEADKLEAEAAALAHLAEETNSADRRLLDLITVDPGLEQALVASLGDDLEAPEGGDGDISWRTLDPLTATAHLPAGSTPLSQYVKAPSALGRRLEFVGVIADDSDGNILQAQLRPGQRLVTKAGDLWRWDGFVARAGAPTAASRRLEARNRLAGIRQQLETAKAAKYAASATLAGARRIRDASETTEHEARGAWREASKFVDETRANFDAHEKSTRAAREKRVALSEALGRIERDLEEARRAHALAAEELAGQPDLAAADQELAPLRTKAAAERQSLAEAEARVASVARIARDRADRLARIDADIERWQTRNEAAAAQRDTLQSRETEARAAIEQTRQLPDEIAKKRVVLAETITAAERRRQQAADILAEAESTLAAVQKEARALEASLGEARAALAGSIARSEAAEERSADIAVSIQDALSMRPEGALAAAGYQTGDDLPLAEATETRLARLRADRERLGAVNLRAEEEAAEQSARLETLNTEREDLEKAIRRLRHGISSLNTEARGRLLEAFEAVNGHFRDLFHQLFGGGTAELTMTEADDPLDAGLEIVASPPGKKPQTLTLLSGGEQALTAIALILAVFRTNPSPICVLDEVDAPLDDANVERFCNVIETLAHNSDTRFLVITHHAYTMARMDRLFGVTMGERGVSQLVSVDLDTAHSYREAG